MRKPLIPDRLAVAAVLRPHLTAHSGSSAQGGTQNGSAQSAQANEENYYTDPVPEGMPEPVEPQDTAVNQDSQLTCTLLVECSTILNNMGDLTEGKESLVPSDGIIYGPATVVFYEGESVYDVSAAGDAEQSDSYGSGIHSHV